MIWPRSNPGRFLIRYHLTNLRTPQLILRASMPDPSRAFSLRSIPDVLISGKVSGPQREPRGPGLKERLEEKYPVEIRRSWKNWHVADAPPYLDKENIMHFRSTYNQAPARLASLDIETLAPPQPDGGFPPWPLHRPIVASVLTADQAAYGEWEFTIESVTFEDERAAIERIDQLLNTRRCLTFNGRAFDWPVLAMTAMRASAFECRNITDAWASQRYKGVHIDLADNISCFGSAPRAKLEILCEAAGIPVKSLGHGSDVAEMLRDQGLGAVTLYCEEDVTSTLTMFALVQALRSNDPAYSASMIGDLANWVVDAKLEHLDAFRSMSSNAVLERVRLAHRVDEGIRALEERATVAFFDSKM